MDNKEKSKSVIEFNEVEGKVFDIIWKVAQKYKNDVPVSLEDATNNIASLFKPSKVKLPKAAYEWMEQYKGYSATEFEGVIGDFLISYPPKQSKISALYVLDKLSIATLFDAYRYGYELEETEEERIKREMTEVIKEAMEHRKSAYDTASMLYNIARGDEGC